MIDRNFILNLAHVDGDINEYLMSLYNIPVQMGAKNIVEIGSGVSSFALIAAANKNEGHLTSIDIGGWDTLNRTQEGKALMEGEKRFTMVTGNSLDVPLITDIDFLFLDSEHTFNLTLNEMKRWFPQVRKGGIIAMHDTAHESGQQMQCRQALNEFLYDSIDLNRSYYYPIHLLDTKIIGMTILVKV